MYIYPYHPIFTIHWLDLFFSWQRPRESHQFGFIGLPSPDQVRWAGAPRSSWAPGGTFLVGNITGMLMGCGIAYWNTCKHSCVWVYSISQ